MKNFILLFAIAACGCASASEPRAELGGAGGTDSLDAGNGGAGAAQGVAGAGHGGLGGSVNGSAGSGGTLGASGTSNIGGLFGAAGSAGSPSVGGNGVGDGAAGTGGGQTTSGGTGGAGTGGGQSVGGVGLGGDGGGGHSMGGVGGSTAQVCTSKKTWMSGNGPDMRPGNDCRACHAFPIAGTVFPTLHEPNNCDGTGSGGLKVLITGSDNVTLTLTPSPTSGNFYSNFGVKTPFSVKLTNAAGASRSMVTHQTAGSCNSCHTPAGANGAPGRIMAP